MVADPQKSGVLYAMAGQAMHRGDDRGQTWSALGALPDNVFDLTIDPLHTTTFYASVNSQGVFRSVDGGLTWTNVFPKTGVYASFALDTKVSGTLYATAKDGVFVSTNGGDAWEPVSPCLPPIIYAVAVDPLAPATVYVGATGGVYKSTTGGR
jgi:photosystem II stability/assembly factor-like uncharacterized protein